MERNYYMVRGMDSSPRIIEHLIEKEVVAIGWSKLDFTKFRENDNLYEALIEAHRGDENGIPSPSSLGRKHAQIRRFCRIKRGDYILVPNGGQILLGIAAGEQFHCSEDEILGISNQHRVEFIRNKDNSLKSIPRTKLTEGLQRRLRVPGSFVLDLLEFRSEIEKIFDLNYQGYEHEYNRRVERHLAEFRNSLLNQLSKSYIKAGGRGLEELICELLKADGFDDASILSKNRYNEIADADLVATKTDTFLGVQKYLFQVKQHQGTTDETGVKQLIAARDSKIDDAQHFVLITTASLTPSARELAEEQEIIYLEGQELADWIYRKCHLLSYETKAKLGISVEPVVLGN